jgi:DNA repair photolyase
MRRSLPIIRGRGAGDDPPNRFDRLHVELDDEVGAEQAGRDTQYFKDPSRSVLTRNDSPDVPFEWSLNPYRGCEHGCSYCYARPTHEYLGFSAGLDFETRILAKEDAPALLRAALAKPSWKPTALAMSGVTDPYQPVERRLRITRRCLEVLDETRHPVTVITKSSAIERDVDLLASLARSNLVHATLSITTLDRALQRAMEPRAAPPEHRLRAIRTLTGAGVPVSVGVAPVIPGLTEHEIPSILEAAADAGARSAGMILLRLPGAVEGIFLRWLREHLPERFDRVVARLKEVRGGRLSDPRFGSRMTGEGLYADQIRRLFQISLRRLNLNRRSEPLSLDAFRRPKPADRDFQLDLLGHAPES